MSKAWAGGSTRAWRRTRARILARDGHVCQLQLEDCTTTATEVHHTRGKANGDNPAHLVAACRNCNGDTGDPNRTDPDPQPRTTW